MFYNTKKSYIAVSITVNKTLFRMVTAIKRSDFQIKKCKCKIKDKKTGKRIIVGKYMVKRVGGTSRQHTHLRSMFGARKLIQLIISGEMPINPYLNESARRLLTNEEFARLELNLDDIYSYQKWKAEHETKINSGNININNNYSLKLRC